jgi:uncharacterized cupredoxin-like copper-binding protein
MKRIALLSLLSAGVLMVSACGSTPPAAQPQPTAQAEPATAEPTEAPAMTETATQAPPPVEGPTRVEVTLADNTIVSSLTTFKAGVPYLFVVSNHGRREHNFNISPPAAVAGGITEALASVLLTVDDTQLPMGSGASVEYTFPDSAVGMVLEFNCLIRRHYEDGMRLDITVTK